MPEINILYLSANCNDVVIDNASITRVYTLPNISELLLM